MSITTEKTTINVPIKLVVADPAKNFRTSMGQEEVKELALAMQETGQLQAVGGYPLPNGKYELVFGFRRFAAAQLLGWPSIRMEVQPDNDELGRKISNLSENLARESLTPYDQAMAFAALKRDHKLSGGDIGKKTGKGTSYINNLVRIVESCEPVILERWKMEQSPSFGIGTDGKKMPTTHQVCTTDWLVKVAATVPRAEQENHLKRSLGLIGDEDEDGEEKGSGSGGEKEKKERVSVRRATMSNLNKALAHMVAKAKEEKGEEKVKIQLIIATLKFATGASLEIKTGKITWWSEQMEENKEIKE